MTHLFRAARDFLSSANVHRAAFIAIACLCAPLGMKAQVILLRPESVAEGARIQQTPEFKEFIDQYIAAVNAKDRKALTALYDPVSRAAMAKHEKIGPLILSVRGGVGWYSSPEYWDSLIPVAESAMADKIPAKPKVVVSAIGPKDLFLDEMGVVYAVRPMLFVQIYLPEVESVSSSGVTAMSYPKKYLFVTYSEGKWRVVWVTPADEKKMAALQEQAG